ncbi:hypothetical protein V8G54_000688 [Vigna mungo]|uniref:Uncharacterized protein n=1 Tax=Vigna mungo TaxID=3915 RepID=A0AAQ3SB31_VIGMU
MKQAKTRKKKQRPLLRFTYMKLLETLRKPSPTTGKDLPGSVLSAGLCGATLFPCFREGGAEAASRELWRGRVDRRRDFSHAVAAAGAGSLDGGGGWWCCSCVKVVGSSSSGSLWVLVLIVVQFSRH